MPKIVDLAGQTIGTYVVVRALTVSRVRGDRTWRCECSVCRRVSKFTTDQLQRRPVLRAVAQCPRCERAAAVSARREAARQALADGYTLDAIGAQMGVTRQRVKQISAGK